MYNSGANTFIWQVVLTRRTFIFQIPAAIDELEGKKDLLIEGK